MSNVNEEKNKWKEALIDALVIDFIYCNEHENNPRKAIHDLCYWEQQVALDPLVSKEARNLRDTYLPQVKKLERFIKRTLTSLNVKNRNSILEKLKINAD